MTKGTSDTNVTSSLRGWSVGLTPCPDTDFSSVPQMSTSSREGPVLPGHRRRQRTPAPTPRLRRGMTDTPILGERGGETGSQRSRHYSTTPSTKTTKDSNDLTRTSNLVRLVHMNGEIPLPGHFHLSSPLYSFSSGAEDRVCSPRRLLSSTNPKF